MSLAIAFWIAKTVEYLITNITGFLEMNRESFLVAVTAIKNLREWAKEKREELVAAANKKALAIALPSDSGMSSLSWYVTASLT